MGGNNRLRVAGIFLLAVVLISGCSSNDGAHITAPRQPSSDATGAQNQRPERELSEAARDYATKCETAA